MFILENGAAFNDTAQLDPAYKYQANNPTAVYENAALIWDNFAPKFYVVVKQSNNYLSYVDDALNVNYGFSWKGSDGHYIGQVYNVDFTAKTFDLSIYTDVSHTNVSFTDLNDFYRQTFNHYPSDITGEYKSDYTVLYVGTVYVTTNYETIDYERSPEYIGYQSYESVATDNVWYDSANYLWHGGLTGYYPTGVKFKPWYTDFDGNKAYVDPIYIQVYDGGQTVSQGSEINVIFADNDRSGESISSEVYIQYKGFSVSDAGLYDTYGYPTRFYTENSDNYYHYYIDDGNLHQVYYESGVEGADINLGAYTDALLLNTISDKYVYGSRGEFMRLTPNLIKSSGYLSQALSTEEEEPPVPPTPTGNKTIYRRRDGVLKEIIPIEDTRTDGGLVAYNDTTDSLETTDTATLANLTVTDTAEINHATIVTEEDIHSEADFIELRVGNPLPTPSTGSGIQINNYNGQGDDLNLITTADGTLRLGEPGDEEPILTRDESTNLANGAPLVWDAANLRAITSSTTDGNKVLKSVKNSTTGVVTYEWSSSGSGAVWRGTQAQLAAALLITDPNDENYIPNNAMIIVTDADEEYLTDEEVQ